MQLRNETDNFNPLSDKMFQVLLWGARLAAALLAF